MATLLQARALRAEAGTRALFDAIDLTVQDGDRIGLVGENGCGKSTLLSILGRQRAPESGDLTWRAALRLSSVEQFLDPALAPRTALEATLDRLDSSTLESSQHAAEALLSRLGFAPRELTYRAGDLSGGQQNRLMFARAVINEPELVLFDEPTNHLDVESIPFFDETMRSLSAGFVLISHDRDFLAAVTTRALFLRDGRLYDYAMPYSAAVIRIAPSKRCAKAPNGLRFGAESTRARSLPARRGTWSAASLGWKMSERS